MIHSTSFRGRAPPVDLLALLIGAGPLSSGAPLWGNADERGQLISSPGTHVAGEETKYFPRHSGSAPMARNVVSREEPGRADQEKRRNQVKAGLDSARLASFFPGLANCTSSLERNRADFPGHLYGGVFFVFGPLNFREIMLRLGVFYKLRGRRAANAVRSQPPPPAPPEESKCE